MPFHVFIRQCGKEEPKRKLIKKIGLLIQGHQESYLLMTKNKSEELLWNNFPGAEQMLRLSHSGVAPQDQIYFDVSLTRIYPYFLCTSVWNIGFIESHMLCLVSMPNYHDTLNHVWKLHLSSFHIGTMLMSLSPLPWISERTPMCGWDQTEQNTIQGHVKNNLPLDDWMHQILKWFNINHHSLPSESDSLLSWDYSQLDFQKYNLSSLVKAIASYKKNISWG